MKNERMITRKLFISCILILCIIFITIIVLQKEYYENKLNQKSIINNDNTDSPLLIIDDNTTGMENVKAKQLQTTIRTD